MSERRTADGLAPDEDHSIDDEQGVCPLCSCAFRELSVTLQWCSACGTLVERFHVFGKKRMFVLSPRWAEERKAKGEG
jgi:hypothetical protein